MMLPHPLLRPADLRAGPSQPDLRQLAARTGIHLLYNARAAIYQLACALRLQGRSTMLVPSFHCPSMIEPILQAGMRPVFYRIDRNLEPDLSDVAARLDGRSGAVLFVNFLGWPSHFEPLLDELRQREILAVEDCAHAAMCSSPLRLAGCRGDAAIYSFAKFVPAGTGGGLWLHSNFSIKTKLERPALRDSAVLARDLLEELVHSRGDETWAARGWNWLEAGRGRLRGLLRKRPKESPRNDRATGAPAMSWDQARQYFFSERQALSRMPWMSRQIMARADLAGIAATRRRNHQALTDGIDRNGPMTMLRPELPADVIPHAFPMIVANRSRHDVRLRAAGVPVWTFGSTLHHFFHETADASVVDDASYLSENMLLLPVHQLLAKEDMTRFAFTINQYMTREMPCK